MPQDGYPPSIRVGVLVFDGFEPLDVWGFVQAFSISCFVGTGYSDGTRRPFEILLISNEVWEKGDAMPGPVRSHNGPRVAPDLYRDQAAGAGLDVLMIPGGAGTRVLLQPGAAREALLGWVRAMDASTPVMASVCTGAAVLAAAGVLDGKPAATNHQAFAWVTAQGPKVLWDSVARWVDAGRHVTSAGVSAGTDMAFHLVSRLGGRAMAEAAALASEYDWHRDPNRPIRYPAGAVVPSTRD